MGRRRLFAFAPQDCCCAHTHRSKKQKTRPGRGLVPSLLSLSRIGHPKKQPAKKPVAAPPSLSSFSILLTSRTLCAFDKPCLPLEVASITATTSNTQTRPQKSKILLQGFPISLSGDRTTRGVMQMLDVAPGSSFRPVRIMDLVRLPKVRSNYSGPPSTTPVGCMCRGNRIFRGTGAIHSTELRGDFIRAQLFHRHYTGPPAIFNRRC